MKPAIHRLSKAELVYLATHRCKHRHTLLDHYACYERAPQRIGFLDIETHALTADFGIMLSWCIKDSMGGILEDSINELDLAVSDGDEDRRIVKHLTDVLPDFDLIVTYYGTKFDLPFIRTRAVQLGIEFPPYGAVKHKDVYYMIRHKFKLSSNRLAQATKVLLGESQKTAIEYKYWRAAARGNGEALAYVLDHNRKDVLDLERLYNKVIGFARERNVSI